MRAFESEFVRVTVDAYPTVLTTQAEVPAKMANGLYVGRMIGMSCEFDDLGDLVRLAHRCALHVLEAEFG